MSSKTIFSAYIKTLKTDFHTRHQKCPQLQYKTPNILHFQFFSMKLRRKFYETEPLKK